MLTCTIAMKMNESFFFVFFFAVPSSVQSPPSSGNELGISPVASATNVSH